MTKEAAATRRRTGAVNGIVAFQSQEPRKYKKKDLQLPFMDSVSIIYLKVYLRKGYSKVMSEFCITDFWGFYKKKKNSLTYDK